MILQSYLAICPLKCIKSHDQGKNVLLVDDSIIRGTTMALIVAMVRKAGAERSVMPPAGYIDGLA
jgi:glutamine phosphoribosylpyrophosphate amidotransferase